jgi:nucleoside-diphosphate-sugar epimerase
VAPEARTVLVTGATGYLGRRVVAALRARGDEVVALRRPGGRAPPPVVRSFEADGAGDVVAGVLRARPAAILHLAAHYVRDHEVSEVDALVAGNVALTVRVLEAARRAGGVPVVLARSAFEDLPGPPTLYAALKAAGSALAAHYAAAWGVPVARLRLHDVYGPADPRPRLLPAALAALRGGRPLVRPAPEATLQPVFIDDVVAAFLAAADAPPAAGEVVDRCAAGPAVSVQGFLDALGAVAGRPVPMRDGATPPRPIGLPAPLPGVPLAVGLSDGLARCWRAASGEADGGGTGC